MLAEDGQKRTRSLYYHISAFRFYVDYMVLNSQFLLNLSKATTT